MLVNFATVFVHMFVLFVLLLVIVIASAFALLSCEKFIIIII
jgi:hypothetical protein